MRGGGSLNGLEKLLPCLYIKNLRSHNLSSCRRNKTANTQYKNLESGSGFTEPPVLFQQQRGLAAGGLPSVHYRDSDLSTRFLDAKLGPIRIPQSISDPTGGEKDNIYLFANFLMQRHVN